MIVRYDRAMEMEALRRGRQMVKNGLYNRMGFSYGQRVNKAKIGCLGELAFQKALRHFGIAHETDDAGYENRNSDNFDFCINGKLIDVKVAKATTPEPPNDSWTYGYPVEQTTHNKDYVVVGVVREGEGTVTFYGWIPFPDIKSYPITDKNTYAAFDYKTLNHEFPYGDMNKDFTALWSACNE